MKRVTKNNILFTKNNIKNIYHNIKYNILLYQYIA